MILYSSLLSLEELTALGGKGCHEGQDLLDLVTAVEHQQAQAIVLGPVALVLTSDLHNIHKYI